MTWAELSASLQARWSITSRRPDSLTAVVKLQGRSQKLVLVKQGGTLTVLAEVCYKEQLAGHEALRYNATSAHGDLALVGGVYALRRQLALDRASLADVEESLGDSAVEATVLAQRVARPPLASAVSQAYAGYLD